MKFMSKALPESAASRQADAVNAFGVIRPMGMAETERTGDSLFVEACGGPAILRGRLKVAAAVGREDPTPSHLSSDRSSWPQASKPRRPKHASHDARASSKDDVPDRHCRH